MLFRNMISQYGAQNIEENGEIVGFEFQFHFPDSPHMSIALFEKIEVFLDGKKFSGNDIKISVDHCNFYRLDELINVREIRWEYGKTGIVRVLKTDGVKTGCHQVKCVMIYRGAEKASEDTQGCRMLTFV